MLEIVTEFLQADSRNFRANRKDKIKYLVVHYTANDGDTAENNAKYFARASRGTSAHYFVDEKEIWQSVKDEDVAWHCGSTKYYHPECRNENSIGVELCSYKDNSGYHISGATQSKAIELLVALMKKYDIDLNHMLRHYDVTHKSCPAPFIEESIWRNFKERVAAAMEERKSLVVEVKGKEVVVEAIELDGVNYVRLRDIPKLIPPIEVGYDDKKGRPTIK